jgi:SAM-dependent methyltransferase
MNQPQAFDALAPTYDADFTESPIARYLRGQVQDRLSRHFQAGDRVLELGCGTGEDALFLARRGVAITATDSSPVMLSMARTKLAAYPQVQLAQLDLQQLSTITDHQPPATSHYAGIFSNFGAVNCLSEWRTLAAWLSDRLVTGGLVALGVMSPLCVWEPLWHGLHGEWAVARRRWGRAGATFASPNGEQMRVYYPTIRRLTQDFAPWFDCVAVRPLGVFLPPSDVYGVIEKRPALLRALMALERGMGAWPLLAPFADHYWIEFKRKPAP